MNKEQQQANRIRRWQELSGYDESRRQPASLLIAGLDEAGRGPLAGPVTAAAVILPPGAYLPGVDDSKKLSEKQRLEMEARIKEGAIAWSCQSVAPEIIDEINILQAARLAMLLAAQALEPQPGLLLIDAISIDSPLPQLPLIRGDNISLSIAAASIIAKCERDRLMTAYDALYPGYGFAQHKGYPTLAHKEALARLGPCPIHRRSFSY